MARGAFAEYINSVFPSKNTVTDVDKHFDDFFYHKDHSFTLKKPS